MGARTDEENIGRAGLVGVRCGAGLSRLLVVVSCGEGLAVCVETKVTVRRRRRERSEESRERG